MGERITHPGFAGIEFVHVRAKSLLNHVLAAAGMPFEWTINVYRGCTHACTYCFARPSHAYLDLDAGGDFESVVVVKVNAVERLRAELRAPRWTGAHVAALVGIGVGPERQMSIPTLDEDVWRASEPGTPHPRARLEAIAALADAGVPAGVFVAPIIPGLSDGHDQLAAVVQGAIEAGASSIVPIVLHLRPGVLDVFLPWLEGFRPDLLARYEELYRRSYAPKDVTRQLVATVHDLVRRNGGTRPRPAGTRPLRSSRQQTDDGTDRPEPEQLSIL
jgi:DNA repair photolyase